MASKGCCPILFVLLATMFILEPCTADYQKFLRQHYDYPTSSPGGSYCNTMMSQRELTKPMRKEVNTFIHEPKNKITAVCGAEGEDYGNGLRRSLKQFSVTTCKMRGVSTKPPCEYRGSSSERYIVIACQNGQPIHYDEGHQM